MTIAECPHSNLIENGICDGVANVPECRWDGGDCLTGDLPTECDIRQGWLDHVAQLYQRAAVMVATDHLAIPEQVPGQPFEHVDTMSTSEATHWNERNRHGGAKSTGNRVQVPTMW